MDGYEYGRVAFSRVHPFNCDAWVLVEVPKLGREFPCPSVVLNFRDAPLAGVCLTACMGSSEPVWRREGIPTWGRSWSACRSAGGCKTDTSRFHHQMCRSTAKLVATCLSDSARNIAPERLGDYSMHTQVLALKAEPTKPLDVVSAPQKATARIRLGQPAYRMQNPWAVARVESDGQGAITLATAGPVLHGVVDGSAYPAFVSSTSVRGLPSTPAFV